MRALIGWGADLQECDQSGKTPLQLALASQPPRSLELARTLLEEHRTWALTAFSSFYFLKLGGVGARNPRDRLGQVLLALRSALTRDLAEESIGSDPSAAAGRVAGSRRSSAGAFSRMANHEDRPKKQVARSTPGAFSKLQSSDELTTPLSDQARSGLPARSFQEMYGSAEGLLNQVDLEEAYEDDWTVQTLPRRVSPRGDGERSQVGVRGLASSWKRDKE
eukprot:g32380.t1